MTAWELITAIESAGGTMTLCADGEHVHCKIPARAEALLKEARCQRVQILDFLKNRQREHTAQSMDRANIDSSDTKRAFVDTVSQWLRERCVVSGRCASNMENLSLEFLLSERPSLHGEPKHMFADLVLSRGFRLGEGGMLHGLARAEDFLAALRYESPHKSLPAIDGRNYLKGKTDMTMLITNKQKEFEIPNEGEHLAVLADVMDLGETETLYGLKDRLQFNWLVEQRGADGNLLSVRQKPHNKSMHEKSSLRRDIKRILGRDPGDTFDVETLLGVNSLLEIEHYTREGHTYANITAIRRPANGDRVLQIPEDFKRHAGTKLSKPPVIVNPVNGHDVAVTDEDIPF